MVGGVSVVVDSHTSPCLCLDLIKSGELGLQRNSIQRKQVKRPVCSLELGSSFVDSWHKSRLSYKVTVGKSSTRIQRKDRRLVVVSELAGQYEDNFDDVKKQIQVYFTYKAVRTVLNQLYEMNPTKYRWFYDFVASNKPGDGKNFMRLLVKKCNHAEIYEEISNENLELMRERLMETVIWPSDDSNTEKIG